MFKKITEKEFITTEWSGGTTTQVGIFPEDKVYADRDFLWRISSATVDLDETDFSSLPDYDRFISTLQGDMTLAHDEAKKIYLKPYDIYAFSGGIKTHSWGRCRDFNLMVRKGECTGALSGVEITKAGQILSTAPKAEQIMIFNAEGSITVSYNGKKEELAAFEAVYITEKDGDIVVDAPVGSRFMQAEMWKL